MKLLISGLVLILSGFVVATPLLACGKDHGYTKSAERVKQSSIPLTEKTNIKRIIAQSEADHDKYTKIGNYTKMNEAVRVLASINKLISR